MKRWAYLTEQERIARLTAGRRDPATVRAETLLAAESEPDWVRAERARLFADLSGNCEAREIRD